VLPGDWKNVGGIGHMALVGPASAPAPARAQAGRNANQTDAAAGFGGGPERLAAIVYFAAVLPAP
jgi:hypothetical protein